MKTINFSEEDWKKLSPYEFEIFCTELLMSLGFNNVQLGGLSGDEGIDIKCEKSVEAFPGKIKVEKWIIQCKLYKDTISFGQLNEDLSNATRHKVDNWWLITTARLTANTIRALEDYSLSGRFPFAINYLDRTGLENVLANSLKVISKYWPEKVQASELAQIDAMDLMSKGKYGAAIDFLEKKDDGSHPRILYLLACCYSMIAQNGGGSEDLSKALDNLHEASKRGYMEHMHNTMGWPRNKILHEIQRDSELQFLKQNKNKEFNNIFSEPGISGGGCFPSNTQISINNGKVIPISDLKPDQEVCSFTTMSSVESIKEFFVSDLIEINSIIVTTYDHLFYSISGWKKAEDLRIGDILNSKYGPILIFSIEFFQKSTKVYNIKLRDQPNYYANGFLVHNGKCI
jgi:hypothetical protein